MEAIHIEALAILKASAKPDICTLQRRMGIGYGRARQIMDALIEAGAVTTTFTRGISGYPHIDYTVNQ